jgi:hypothetical protein
MRLIAHLLPALSLLSKFALADDFELFVFFLQASAALVHLLTSIDRQQYLIDSWGLTVSATGPSLTSFYSAVSTAEASLSSQSNSAYDSMTSEWNVKSNSLSSASVSSSNSLSNSINKLATSAILRAGSTYSISLSITASNPAAAIATPPPAGVYAAAVGGLMGVAMII